MSINYKQTYAFVFSPGRRFQSKFRGHLKCYHSYFLDRWLVLRGITCRLYKIWDRLNVDVLQRYWGGCQEVMTHRSSINYAILYVLLRNTCTCTCIVAPSCPCRQTDIYEVIILCVVPQVANPVYTRDFSWEKIWETMHPRACINIVCPAL